MSETCWYMRFGTMDSCQEQAKWKASTDVIARSLSPSFTAACRWCDKHKQIGDERIALSTAGPDDGQSGRG